MNVLITGGSGLIAGRLALYIKNMCNVTLASRKKISPIEKVKMITANKLDSKDLLSQDIIIHTASPNDKQCDDKKVREKYLNDTKITGNIAATTLVTDDIHAAIKQLGYSYRMPFKLFFTGYKY